MKRFTETNKWRDPWYRKLSSPAKQLWEYVRDNCDSIGLVDLDLGLVSSDCGQSIDNTHILELGDRLQKISDVKFFLPKFINFQYGELSKSCPPHRNIIKLIEIHSLVRVGLHYRYPSATLSPQVVENQQNHYPSVRVDLPYKTRQDKTVQDQGGTGEIFLPPSPNGNAINDFEKFWNAYPKKVARGDAEHAWSEVGASNHLGLILTAVKAQSSSEDWSKDGGRFVPKPSTWLRDKRWTDEPPKEATCF